MPELPDVELYRRHSRRAFRRPIANVEVGASRLLEGISRVRLAAALEADQFVSSRRHGKHLFFRLEHNGWLQIIATRGATTPIKSVLMDQSLLAGVGNIYADEILYQARVYPLTRARRLTPVQVRAVYASIGRVLRTAIGCRADAEHLAERLPSRFMLRVRGSEGHCPRCRRGLATFKLSGRTGYYCPRCQPR